ncbi:MAG: biosynthetic arginine decarboxylase [Candidatus Competibacteraceae bacterium]|nr:biosynthetic arginine decarboxylase [Candidatus Competibacteraceae bacterium]
MNPNLPRQPGWTIDDARGIYNIDRWGGGYFDIDPEGRIRACSRGDDGHPGIDLHALAGDLQAQGYGLPVLVRFNHILHQRVDSLCQSFAGAIRELDYQGRYTLVYPIKVNQQRPVVSEILRHGGARVGLEAGSKPELMAVIALSRPHGTVVCNGYKDREYIRLALIGLKLGLNLFIVVEKMSELEVIIRESRELGVRPQLGIRVRLASMGVGKWQDTGGEKSKFGLSAGQVLETVERLRTEGMEECVGLLHCHLGSQVANIRDIQGGLKEVGRFYAELHRLGAKIRVVDVGGGLGVDYEGTASRSECSMNYSVREYANNVVYYLWEVCTEHHLPHPDLFTESGRALTAHHAVLVTNVIDHEQAPGDGELAPPGGDDPLILRNLWEVYQDISRVSAVEAYHDAAHWLGEAQGMYLHGVLGLEQRARAERLYYGICRKVHPLLNPYSRAHRELLDELNEKLAEKLFLNFSLFQSIPDVWAIDQIFPIMPLHRLDERPVSRVVLQDLTCDSDGRVENYVDAEGVETTLPLPPYHEGEPFLLGIFLVGAYQEILGDMHNLFGDTDAVNVELTGDGYRVVEPEHGDTVSDLLRYVHYEPETLLEAYRGKIGTARLAQGEREAFLADLEAGLRGYTYLED